MVIRLMLLEGLPRSLQYLVRFACGESFERPHELAWSNPRRGQKMHMIRHNGEGVQFIVAEIFVAPPDCFHNQARDFRPSQVRGAGSGSIQEAVDPRERRSGIQLAGWG